MKNFISRALSLSLISFVLIAGAAQRVKAQDVTVSYQTFYDNLAPYGQWINDPDYGNVWVPNEEGDFRPYGSRGHWVMTEYGNTWVSEDPWGWAVYHYGRWTYNPYYGWVWVPGYEWAPAWVSWRYGGSYCGWAPLGPNMSVGVSYNYPDSWWIFVGPQYMYQPNCMHYWRGPSYNSGYIHQTTIVNNYYVDNGTHVRYNYGPRAEVIQQTTHQPVQVYRVSQLNRPGASSISRNTVSLYRPTVNRATVSTARPTTVMQAPRPIGRTPEPANAPGNSTRPAFRQEMQRQAPANNPAQPERGNQPNNVRGNEPARQPVTQPTQPTRDNRPQPAPQPQRDNRPQPTPQPQHQPENRPQPAPQPQRENRPQPAPQPQRQPAPQMQRENRPQPAPQPQPGFRPQPAPQPMRPQPAPQPMRPQPAPQPMRPQPAPQPQHQPAPPRAEEPREGGRR